MDLQEVRNNINKIDDNMKELFIERLDCSKKVAEVKMEQNDDVYKPVREKEICERFADECGGMYIPFIKKVMHISRKYQYGQFINNEKIDTEFWNNMSEEQQLVLEQGGEFGITVCSDESCDNGLCIKEIMSIIADTSLSVHELEADGVENTVYVRLMVDDTEEARFEALTLAYLLYKETI